MITAASAVRRAVPERFAWAMNLLLVGGVVYAVICVGTLVAGVADLAQWVQPGATVPVTMDTSYVLPVRHGTNSYGGGPYVRDGEQVTATAVTATLSGVALVDRVLLGVAPILTALTLLAVTWLLVLAVRRLRHGAGFGRAVSDPVIAAAAVLVVGSTLAAIVQGIANFRVMAFMWPAPADGGSMFRTTIVTFEFGPLFFALGLLVVALILRRGLVLQQDTEGLV